MEFALTRKRFIMAEKVTLTPDGLMVSRWNGETRENDEELMEENCPTVLSHLRTYCEIDPDTTIWHIMDFVRKNEALTFFISQYTWTNSIDEFHAELDKPAVIDENDKMDHLEIYWSADYHKSKKYTSFGMSAGFHGVGLPLKAEDQEAAKEMVEKSGQMGVPQIVIGEKIIVGFDKAAIEAALKETE